MSTFHPEFISSYFSYSWGSDLTQIMLQFVSDDTLSHCDTANMAFDTNLNGINIFWLSQEITSTHADTELTSTQYLVFKFRWLNDYWGDIGGYSEPQYREKIVNRITASKIQWIPYRSGKMTKTPHEKHHNTENHYLRWYIYRSPRFVKSRSRLNPFFGVAK